MKGLKKEFINFCILKLKSKNSDKLTNMINALNLFNKNQIKVNKTSQLYMNNDELFAYVKIEFDQEKSQMIEIVDKMIKSCNYNFHIEFLSINDNKYRKNSEIIDLEINLKAERDIRKVIGVYRKNNSILLDKDKTHLMAIINCTNDSFSEGGLLKNYNGNKEKDYEDILKYLEDNKDFYDIIDIGGESTRPNSLEVDPKEELERIFPIVRLINLSRILKDKVISIDTRKSYVAQAILKEGGVDIINDVSGGNFDREMYEIVAKANCPYICMHMRGCPKTMSNKNNYMNLTEEVINELKLSVEECENHNIYSFNIWVDPGFGFSKVNEQNYELLENLSKFKKSFSNTLMVGTSRKSFIKNVVGLDTRMGDAVITSHCISKGADIVRVHDFKEMKKVCAIADKLYKYNPNTINICTKLNKI